MRATYYGLALCLAMLVVPLLVLVADPPEGKAASDAGPAAQGMGTAARSMRSAVIGATIPVAAPPGPVLDASPPQAAEAEESAPPTTGVRRTTTTTEAPTTTAPRRTTTTTEAPPPEPAATAGNDSGGSSGSANSGLATWYHAPDATCAHRSLPMGTMITVTRASSGASVTCRVADRGPFVDGVIIDLSMDTFEQIAAPSVGIVQVTISY